MAIGRDQRPAGNNSQSGAGSLFAAGACSRGSQPAFAQAQTKTIVQAVQVATVKAFGKPKTPPAPVTGKVVGFAYVDARCFALVEKWRLCDARAGDRRMVLLRGGFETRVVRPGWLFGTGPCRRLR